MRLLIVEDEQGMAEGLRDLLEKQGYAADLAFDGISGLDNGLTGLYDLIILDIMLPGRDGCPCFRSCAAAASRRRCSC